MNPNKDKSVCEYNEFRRPRYFHGMLLDDKDFLDEQGYHAGKRRLLNRMLHGTGVVCGLDLNAEKGGRWIEITAGLALDCCGNEIYVNKTRRFDLAQLVPPKKAAADRDECKESGDTKDGARYYIGIRYDEKETNPVAVYLPGGGCEERTCESSRVKEGYCVEVVDCCPKKYPPGLLSDFCGCTHDYETPVKSWAESKDARCGECKELQGSDKCMCVKLEEFCERSVPCPECGRCESPCHVVLGRVDVDREGRVTNVCINECREYVLTGGLVRHLVVGAFAGAGKFFTVKSGSRDIPIPDIGEVAHNPVLALCWFVRTFIIDKARMEGTEECKKLFDQLRRLPEQFGKERTGQAAGGPPPPPESEAAPATVVPAARSAQQKELKDLQRRTQELEALVKELQSRLPPPPPPAPNV